MADQTIHANADQLQGMLNASPVTRFLQLQIVSIDVDAADGHAIGIKMPMRAELERMGGSGQFQGGPIATLIDTTGVYALIAATGLIASTVNFSVDYLRPAVGSMVLATARVRRAGRSIATVDIEVADEKGALCALGRGCFSLAQAPSLAAR